MANLNEIAGFTFNPLQYEPDTGGGGALPVSGPDGLLVVITGSNLKKTKSGNGGYIEFSLQVIEGEHNGATGTARINIVNPNKQAEEIGKAQLSAVCHVTGCLDELVDTVQLHNTPFRVLTRIQQFKGDPEKQKEAEAKGYTEVYAYRDADGNKPGEQGQPPAQQAASQQQAANAGQGQGQSNWGSQQQPAQQQGGWGQQPAQQQASPPQQGGWGQQQQQDAQTPPNGSQGGWGQGAGKPAWG